MVSSFPKTFLADIKERLLKEQERLERELEVFAHKNPRIADDFEAVIPEYGDEPEDNAREMADYAVNKPLEETLERALRDVTKALKRLEEEKYGICKYCDKLIEEKRLLARPTSSSCVSCKKTLTDEA